MEIKEEVTAYLQELFRDIKALVCEMKEEHISLDAQMKISFRQANIYKRRVKDAAAEARNMMDILVFQRTDIPNEAILYILCTHACIVGLFGNCHIRGILSSVEAREHFDIDNVMERSRKLCIDLIIKARNIVKEEIGSYIEEMVGYVVFLLAKLYPQNEAHLLLEAYLTSAEKKAERYKPKIVNELIELKNMASCFKHFTLANEELIIRYICVHVCILSMFIKYEIKNVYRRAVTQDVFTVRIASNRIDDLIKTISPLYS
jgi:hypothetical protein